MYRFGTSRRRVHLKDQALEPRDQRLQNMLKPDMSFSRQKRLSPVAGGGTLSFEDIGTTRYQPVRTLGEAYELLESLGGHSDLRTFAFLKRWDQLSDKEKQDKLSEFGCHELHVFIYFKDRVFFDKVVKAHIANKKDKTFVDRWLLGEDLSTDLQVVRQQNAFEQVLWGMRLKKQKLVEDRMREFVEINTLMPEERNRLIQTALRSSELVAPRRVKGVGKKEQSKYLERSSGKLGAAKAPQSRAFADAAMAKEAMPLTESAPVDGRRELNFGYDQLTRSESDRLAFEAADETRRLYRKMPLTKEWAEQNYYKLRIEHDVADSIKPNAFWQDVAAGVRLSPNLLEANTSFSEVILALALTDLPFESEELEEVRDDAKLTLKSATGMLVVHEEILPAAESKDDRPLLSLIHI